MPKRIWMPLTKRGAPLSHTFCLRANDGTLRRYRFERNKSVLVEDEHVDIILNSYVRDQYGQMFKVFTTTPPPDNVSDTDALRMQVEAQQDKITQLESVVKSLLEGRSDIDLEESLGVTSGDSGDDEDNTPEEILAGMV